MLITAVCAAVKGNGFQGVCSGIEYITECLGLEYGIIFHQTDQLVEEFTPDSDNVLLGIFGVTLTRQFDNMI